MTRHLATFRVIVTPVVYPRFVAAAAVAAAAAVDAITVIFQSLICGKMFTLDSTCVLHASLLIVFTFLFLVSFSAAAAAAA